MRWIKTYKKYQESIIVDLSFGNVSDVLESLTIWHDALLNSIRAEEKDIFSTLKLSDDFRDRLNFDDIHDSVEFINSLSSIALKKSQVENSEDYQTFLNKPCKFMFLYDINSNELENPQYLMFQTWNDTVSKWESLKLYKINDDVKKFYDKLTSRTIEITDADQNYIYQTSNGNEWVLQNVDKENDVYKRTFRKEELQELLKDKNVTVNIL
jgi:hypothetical protein